jgi:acyl-CoA synthetase (AMP-forming)/AMP-acid ligase II
VSDVPNANIARHLRLMAQAEPGRAALKVPRGRDARGRIDYLTLSFAELDAEVARWGTRLRTAGVKPGDRTLVMVRPGLPLIASVFALFRLGAVPVVIDPGMGLRSFLACVQRSQPRAMVGIPMAQVISRVFRSAFRSVAIRVGARGSLTARLGQGTDGADEHEIARGPDDLAAILFTSGSTGAPKGVCYAHGMFEAQVQMIRAAYRITPSEVDLPLLPIFALFNPALGMTTVVPELDPRRPATLDPARIVQAIQQEGVTNSFGSPTLWNLIVTHCRRTGTTLPTLRRVLCAGAPVPATLWREAPRVLSHGRLHSPYGATEALPVASIAADEIDPASVAGACVGRPLAEVEVRVIPVREGAVTSPAELVPLAPGVIGEIVVRGPMATREYDALPEATAQAKIRDGSTVWHRMGDCGYQDATGRLWFCGRKVERVVTAREILYPEPCEQVFRQHPRVGRCALIGVSGSEGQRPALVVEGKPRDAADAATWVSELAALARAHAHTRTIRHFYFHPSFPVDVRHNAKIHRLTLARWALRAKVWVAPEGDA